MLSFSNETIDFDYSEKGHLQSDIKLTNRTMTPIYFKVTSLSIQFKVNRPRFYIVKPDRGIVKPNSSVDVNIKLHK